METSDIYRLADDALKFIDKIDIENIELEDDIILTLVKNKALILQRSSQRIQEILLQFESLYEMIVSEPDRFKIREIKQREGIDLEQLGETT